MRSVALGSTNERENKMRFIIYGAGGIGGTIGARLFQHGHSVILIARGDHLEAMRQKGLIFKSPVETVSLPIPCAGHPSEIKFQAGDIVIMTMKSHHTLEALEALRWAVGEDIPVICSQNGVANEPMAARRFNRVYGMAIFLPATHLEPGVVQTEAQNLTGILDTGCFPSGVDPVIETVVEALSASDFSADADPKIMRQKYAKLLTNLNNALQVLCRSAEETKDISRLMKKEALACYKAAGIDCASREEVAGRRGDLVNLRPVGGKPRPGNSTWQSIVRGAVSIEADYLNGEIVLLGKRFGIPTPTNRVIQQLANALARERGKPDAYSPNRLRDLIAAAQAFALPQQFGTTHL